MNEPNRLRLERITARHAKQTARARSEADGATDAAFLAAFTDVRDEVLRPVMTEVGAQLKAAGYNFEIRPAGDEGSPGVDFHILMPERGDSKDTIRFFALKDAERGWQVVGELDLKRSPVELTRFEAMEDITHDVVEHLIVDAVEQMFSSTVEPLPSEPTPAVPQAAPAQRPVAEAIEVVSLDPSGRQKVDGARSQLSLDHAGASDFFPPMDETREHQARLPPLANGPEMRWARWRGAQTMGETAQVDVGMFQRAALPFTSGPSVPASLAAVDTRPAEDLSAGRPHTGTVEVDVAMFRRPALPFIRGAATRGFFATAEPPGAEDQLSGQLHTGTEEADVARFRRAALPSMGGPPAPAFWAVVYSARAEDLLAGRAHTTGDETMMVPVAVLTPRKGESSTKPPALALERPEITSANKVAVLSVEQYAALHAELAMFAGNELAIHARYGLHEVGTRKALDEAFVQRFQADPREHQRWEALAIRHWQWLREQAVR